jgi:hypothetical protein
MAQQRLPSHLQLNYIKAVFSLLCSFIIEPVQKISFNEYKQLVSLPNALKRSLNEYEAKIRR